MRLQQPSMELGVPWQNSQEHHTVAPHLDDLSHSWIGAVVADDDERTLLEVRTSRRVVDVGVRQAGRRQHGGSRPTDPTQPSRAGHERSLRPARVRSKVAEAGTEPVERVVVEVRQDDVEMRSRLGRQQGKPAVRTRPVSTPGSASSGAGSPSRRTARRPQVERQRRRLHRTRTRVGRRRGSAQGLGRQSVLAATDDDDRVVGRFFAAEAIASRRERRRAAPLPSGAAR